MRPESWTELRERRMAEPGAQGAYEAARIAFEVGASVRKLRETHGWSQGQLARAAGMTQSAIARFEAGGTVPTLPVMSRIASALGSTLTVSMQGTQVAVKRAPTKKAAERKTEARK